ncbi:MAG TPA: DUF4129 domain-containing protein [Myxococcales bacterium]|nr:DUF4129 domain-containing protein [Myxococcales bacterium]
MILALALAVALDAGEYRVRLEEIDSLLAQGKGAAAAVAARALEGRTIRAGEQELVADAWALAPIARGEPRRARLRGLLEAMAGGGRPEPRADPALLEELRRARVPAAIPDGGEIKPLDAPGRSLREQIVLWGTKAMHAFGRAVLRFLRWLASFLPRVAPGTPEKAGRITAVVLVGVGVILAAVIALALLSFRRGAPLTPAPHPEPRVRDDDPLSRSASGWEQRAAELAAQGRHREAIRAWYHAVLTRCASAGVLHPRRGRTNWEYAHSLSPSVPFRDRFEDLTRRFDVEWYGRTESSGEALAAFAEGASGIVRSLGRRT